MENYTFPLNTCERTSGGYIAQPYSAMFNVLSCAIIAVFLAKSKSKASTVVLLSILVFEIYHTLSHTVHISGNIQVLITHILAYIVNACFLVALVHHTTVVPNTHFALFLAAVIMFDIYAFNHLPLIFWLSTQFLIFMSLFVFYYRYLPKEITTRIPVLFLLTFTIVLLFINESYNCEAMLHHFPSFPFHVIIEIVALFIVFNVCKVFSVIQ